ALRGGVFLDPGASEPYLFHLARLTTRRRADQRFAGFNREEVLEGKLVGLQQSERGEVRLCPPERLLLLRDGAVLAEEGRALAGAAEREGWRALKALTQEAQGM